MDNKFSKSYEHDTRSPQEHFETLERMHQKIQDNIPYTPNRKARKKLHERALALSYALFHIRNCANVVEGSQLPQMVGLMKQVEQEAYETPVKQAEPISVPGEDAELEKQLEYGRQLTALFPTDWVSILKAMHKPSGSLSEGGSLKVTEEDHQASENLRKAMAGEPQTQWKKTTFPEKDIKLKTFSLSPEKQEIVSRLERSLKTVRERKEQFYKGVRDTLLSRDIDPTGDSVSVLMSYFRRWEALEQLILALLSELYQGKEV